MPKTTTVFLCFFYEDNDLTVNMERWSGPKTWDTKQLFPEVLLCTSGSSELLFPIIEESFQQQNRQKQQWFPGIFTDFHPFPPVKNSKNPGKPSISTSWNFNSQRVARFEGLKLRGNLPWSAQPISGVPACPSCGVDFDHRNQGTPKKGRTKKTLRGAMNVVSEKLLCVPLLKKGMLLRHRTSM